jgi:hypothetical protein
MLYGFDRPTAPILVMLPPAGMSLPLVSRLALALSADFRPDMLGVARSSRLLQLDWIYVVLLALVLIACMARWLVERRRGLISNSDPACYVRRSSASSISFSMLFNGQVEAAEQSAGALWAGRPRRDLLESSIDLSDPCLVIIELFL